MKVLGYAAALLTGTASASFLTLQDLRDAISNGDEREIAFISTANKDVVADLFPDGFNWTRTTEPELIDGVSVIYVWVYGRDESM